METMQERRAFWVGHVQAWRDSGLTQIAYCQQHDLKPKALAYWIRRSRRDTRTLTLVPLTVQGQAPMWTPSPIWLVVEPVDMRLGIDGLSLRIQQALGRSPCDGSAYLFRNRAATRLKLLQWDGNGVWLAQRRLHRGRFVWPVAGDEVCGGHGRAVALAGERHRLAASRGTAAFPLASVGPWAN